MQYKYHIHIYAHRLLCILSHDDSRFIDQKNNTSLLINQIPEICGFYFFNSQSYKKIIRDKYYLTIKYSNQPFENRDEKS